MCRQIYENSNETTYRYFLKNRGKKNLTKRHIVIQEKSLLLTANLQK